MVHQDKWYSGLFTLVIKTLLKDICMCQYILESQYFYLFIVGVRLVKPQVCHLMMMGSQAEIWSRESNTVCEMSCFFFLAAGITKMLSCDFHVFGFPRTFLRTALGWEPHLLPPNTWQTEITGHMSIYNWLAYLGLIILITAEYWVNFLWKGEEASGMQYKGRNCGSGLSEVIPFLYL